MKEMRIGLLLYYDGRRNEQLRMRNERASLQNISNIASFTKDECHAEREQCEDSDRRPDCHNSTEIEQLKRRRAFCISGHQVRGREVAGPGLPLLGNSEGGPEGQTFTR